MNESEFLLYQSDDGRTRVEVRFAGETAWLSLAQMAELFQRDRSVIFRHIKNVFEEGELRPEATVAKFATVQREGEREVAREVDLYNLDVIISVGYRVKSLREEAAVEARWRQEAMSPSSARDPRRPTAIAYVVVTTALTPRTASGCPMSSRSLVRTGRPRRS